MAQAWTLDMAKDGVSAELRQTTARASIRKFTSAPLLVIACITMADMTKYPDESRQKTEYDIAVQSLGAAIQNMLLAVESKGLGACWFCAPAFCKEAVRKVLAIPEDVEPQALIAVGYPAENPPAPLRKSVQAVSYSGGRGKKPQL
jgi:F420 biosynthesis protein FbiB-like protein